MCGFLFKCGFGFEKCVKGGWDLCSTGCWRLCLQGKFSIQTPIRNSFLTWLHSAVRCLCLFSCIIVLTSDLVPSVHKLDKSLAGRAEQGAAGNDGGEGPPRHDGSPPCFCSKDPNPMPLKAVSPITVQLWFENLLTSDIWFDLLFGMVSGILNDTRFLILFGSSCQENVWQVPDFSPGT